MDVPRWVIRLVQSEFVFGLGVNYEDKTKMDLSKVGKGSSDC